MTFGIGLALSINVVLPIESTAMAHIDSFSLPPRDPRLSPFIELRQALASEVAAISPFADQLMRFILGFRSSDGSESDIEMALHEALVNAVVHGNGENFCKYVYVTCRCYINGDVSITVRDEGRGFDSSVLRDPTGPEALLLNHGRGIYLMRALMDEVLFEEGGTVVIMRKKSNVSPTEETKPQ